MTSNTVTRGRACAIVRTDGRILLNRYGGDSFWALPGGAVEAGEFSADALVRELQEELGVMVEVGRLVWIVENLFAYRGTDFTEYGYYYEAEWPLPPSGIADEEFVGREPDQFFRWVRNGDVASLDFRPAVLRLPLLAHVSGAASAAPVHVMHKDR
jgi:8-oxo-dGTP pyrophosphatase MutT (NUDIX family)